MRAATCYPPLMTPRGRTLKELEYPDGHEMPPHSDGGDRVSILLGGDLREYRGSTEHSPRALDVVTKPGAVVHSDRSSSRTRIFTVVLSAQDAPLEYRWSDGGSAVRHLLEARSFAFSRSGDEGDAARSAVDREIDEVLREAVSRSVRAGPAWWPAAREVLAAPGFRGVRAAATDLGVHPVHLARVCRERTGASPLQLVRRARVKVAVTALFATDLGLGAVAHHAGFCDQSHLCRAFAAELGTTPARLRRSLHGDPRDP